LYAMYFDLERIAQLCIALFLGGFYYFIVIARLKSIVGLLTLSVIWLAGFVLLRDVLVQFVLIYNDGIYPLSMEQYIILGQDIFLALLVFSIGQLKFANDES